MERKRQLARQVFAGAGALLLGVAFIAPASAQISEAQRSLYSARLAANAAGQFGGYAGSPLVGTQFSSPQTETNEAAIATKLDGQLYLVVGKQDETGRWQLRLWWKPLVTLIWLGGALVAIGGFLSLVGRLRRDMALSERQAYA